MLPLFIIALTLYVSLSFYLHRGWSVAMRVSGEKRQGESSPFVVIIPYRDELECLTALLSDMEAQTSDIPDSWAFFFVNDASQDGGPDFLKRSLGSTGLDIRLLEADGEGKKAAIRTAWREISKGTRILTWDADIRLPSDYFLYFGDYIGQEELTILPVIPLPGETLVERYAGLDMLSLMASGLAMAAMDSPVYANGAHMAYTLGGDEDLCDKYKSGDDVFLLHDGKKDGRSIAYTANPLLAVSTAVPDSWRALLRQRQRWASKSSGYRDRDTLILGLVVSAIHLIQLFFLCSMFFTEQGGWMFMAFFGLRFCLDGLFLHSVCQHFSMTSLLRTYPWAFILNSLLFLIVLIRMPWVSIEWKGRGRPSSKP